MNQTSNPSPEQLNDPQGHHLVDGIHQRLELGRLIIGRTTTQAVERIWAAGYRKPQEITTVEELDALPAYSVVIDPHGVAYQHYGRWGQDIQWSAEGRWWSTSQVGLPAKVLHVGGAK